MSDGEVVYRITGDDSGLGSSLDSAGDKISKKTALWTAVANKALDGITNLAVKAGEGVKSLIQSSIDYNSQMETYTTSFTTMLGSADAATTKVAELKDFAAKTPFAMTDLADATKTLLAFGVSNENSSAALKMLGDISQGDANKLSSLSLAFGQVSSAGKLSGQDLLQMINAGYNPLRDISDKTGASIGDLKEKMAGGKGSKEFQAQIKAAQAEVKKLGDNASEGAKMLVQMGEDGYISADLVTQAMESATSEGGLFFGAMEKQSKTFAGQLSTLKDDFNSLNADVFAGLYQSLATDVLPIASGYLSQLSSAFKTGGATGLVSALGNVLGDAISKVTIAFPKVLKTVNSLIKSLLKGISDNKTEIADGLAETLTVAAEGIVDIVPDLLSLLLDIGGELLTSLSAELPTLLPELVTSILDELDSLFSEDSIDTFITTAVTIIENLTEAIVNAVPILIERLPEILHQVADGLLKAAGPILTAAANGIIDIINAIFGTNIPHIEDIEFPTWDEIKEDVSKWWNGPGSILEKLKEALNWALGILNLPDVDTLVSDIKQWWDTTALPAIKAVLNWMLGKLDLPDIDTIVSDIKTWWEKIKSQVGSLLLKVGVDVTTNYYKKVYPTTGILSNPDASKPTTPKSLINDLMFEKQLGFASGGIITGGKRLLSQDGTRNLVGEAGAEGIIPLDTLWYEMDSRLQNTLNKTFGALSAAPVPVMAAAPTEKIDYDTLASKIAAASTGDVYLDGKKVGKVITPYVSEMQGADCVSLQRSGSDA